MSLAQIPDDVRLAWNVHTQVLLDSYRDLLGHDLIARSGDAEEEARRLFQAPFAVLSHGSEKDPLISYANATVLALWELPASRILGMPSRLTAEPANQESRARFLQQTQAAGFATGYEGVRISATGRRFRIEGATLWNLKDAGGSPCGQAATFARWAFL